MNKSEYPETIEETQSLIDELTFLVENERDKERRREMFLLIIELRDHMSFLSHNKVNQEV